MLGNPLDFLNLTVLAPFGVEQLSTLCGGRSTGAICVRGFGGCGKMFGRTCSGNPVAIIANRRWCSIAGMAQSACRMNGSATGPFYCPGDEKIYIDLSFYQELQQNLKRPAISRCTVYVIAHEVGHHVQNLLGTSQTSDVAAQPAQRSGV